MKRLIELMLLAPLATFAVPVLVDSALKGALLLSAILVTMLLLKRSSSALRHAVLVSAMVLLLILPILSVTLPGWRVLPAWAKIAPLEAAAPPVEAEAPAAVEFASDYPIAPTGASVPQSGDAVAEIPIDGPDPGWIPLVAWIWSLGALLLGLRLAMSQAALWHLGRKASPAGDTTITGMALQLKSELGIRRNVEVLVHPGRAMPMTWGIFKTRLLLPATAEGWDEIPLRAVLLHELAHIRRGDSHTQLLVQLTCAAHWFNPLAWIAALRIATERERACDDLVLRSGIRASDYAEHLLRIATGYEARPIASMSTVAMAKRSRLEGRVTSILSKRVDRRSITRRVALGVACGSALLALPVAMMQAVGQEEKTLPEIEIRTSEDNSKKQPELPDAQGAKRKPGDKRKIVVERTGDDVILTKRYTAYVDGDGFTIKLRDFDPETWIGEQPVWTDVSIDDLIAADAKLGSRPLDITISDRSEPAKFEWFDEPTDLATEARNKRGTLRARHEHNDTSPEIQLYQFFPVPKVDKPIFKREFLGGARNLRGYDLRQAADREPVEPETPDDPDAKKSATKTTRKLTRKLIRGKDGKPYFVDLDLGKLSDSFVYEDFLQEESRVDPQPDNLTNLMEKLPGGSFILRQRHAVDSFYSDIPLELDPGDVKDPLAWLNQPTDLMLDSRLSALPKFRYRTDTATIRSVESARDATTAEPPQEPTPATAQSYIEKYPGNRHMQQKADTWRKLHAERAELSKRFKPGAQIMKQNERKIELLESGIIGLGEEIDLGIKHPRTTPESLKEESDRLRPRADEYLRKFPTNRDMRKMAALRKAQEVDQHQLRNSGLGAIHPRVLQTQIETNEIDRQIIDVGEFLDLSFAGIGMMLRSSDGDADQGVVIHDLLDEGPAAKAGTVKEGDRIIGFSEGKKGKWVDTAKMDLVGLVNLIRGRAGTTVRLKLLREGDGDENIHEITLIREMLKLEPADPNPPKPGNGEPVLLPLKNMQAGAAKAAVDAVIAKSDRGRVHADERSNSLIYLGDEATLKLVRSILEWLDQEK